MKLNIQRFAEGEIVIPVDLDSKGFEAQIEKVEARLEELLEDYKGLAKDPFFEKNGTLQKYEIEIEKTKNKLISLREQQEKLESSGGFDFSKTIAKTTSSMGNVINKVARWGIALFGIRSAYNFIRSAVSTLSQQNEGLARGIENIRYGLASALEPVIKRIVDWAYKLMQAINYVWKLLTGKNLFSNMKKGIDKTNKSIKGASKSAKELQKQLAGFDEMNILSKNVEASGGGGAGASSLGNVPDLTGTDLLSKETQQRLKKLANILKKIGDWFSQRSGLIYGAIAGLIGLKIGNKIGKLITALGGNGAMGGLVGGLLALDTVLVTHIIKTIKDDLLPLIEETEKRIDSAIEMTQGRSKAVDKMTDTLIENAKSENENTEQTKLGVNTMLESIKTNNKENKELMDQIGLKGDLTGENKMNIETMKQNRYQNEKYLETLMELYDMGKLEITQLESYRQALGSEKDALIEANKHLNKNSEAYKTNKQRIDKINDALGKLPSVVTTDVKIDTSEARTSLVDYLKDVKSAGAQNIIGLTTSIDNAIKKLKTIKHAKGGIVNLPGRGVPLHVAGEKGQEGIVPLTDSQQMELLGEAIGKYITINANITNTMNGRVISRELQKIQQENSFASNR